MRRLYSTPKSATTTPKIAKIGSFEKAGSAIAGTWKSARSPRISRLVITATATDAMVHTTYRTLILWVISSRQNRVPAIGALNATASPAPASADCMVWISSTVARAVLPHHAPIVAPMCTVGPSLPSTMPPSPMERSPPTKRAGRTLSGAASASPLWTASTCWMPLPAASGTFVAMSPATTAAAADIATGMSHPAPPRSCDQVTTSNRNWLA